MAKAEAVEGAPKEVTRLTTGTWKGRLDCKYMYAANYADVRCWGFAGQGGRDEKQLIASLIQLPIGFLINAGVLTAMLPTTFPRACLVVLFEYLVAIVICIVIAVPLFILLFAARGGP